MHTLRSALALLCLCPFAFDICAQTYPAKPIRYITSGSAGSSADFIARLIGGSIAQQLGKPVIIDTRPGAGGNIGAELAARAPADGYTLYQPTVSQALNMSLYRNLPYDLVRDFVAVTQLVTDPAVVVVHPSLAVKSVSELIKLAKAQPASLRYASAGTGTFTFLAGELFKAKAGIDLMHVPYKGGGPALTAVISGETLVYFSPLGVAMPHVQQSRLRALAVTTNTRVPVMPELPTVSESGVPDFEFGNWYGIALPAKTPRAIVTKLHTAAAAALNDPALRRRITDSGYVIIGSTSEEFAAYVKSQVDALAKVVRALNLTPD